MREYARPGGRSGARLYSLTAVALVGPVDMSVVGAGEQGGGDGVGSIVEVAADDGGHSGFAAGGGGGHDLVELHPDGDGFGGAPQQGVSGAAGAFVFVLRVPAVVGVGQQL